MHYISPLLACSFVNVKLPEMLLLIIPESCLLQKIYTDLHVKAAAPKTEGDLFAVVVLKTFLYAFLWKLHNMRREDEDHCGATNST